MSRHSQDVIRMLYEHQSNYISGQYIAGQLNTSRADVKKVTDLSKENGCDIKSVNHKGHQLNSLPDQWYSGTAKPILNEFGLFNHPEAYHTVDSTQLKAKRALVGNKDTFLISNDRQTEDRGRFNRDWESSKGKGLWISLALRPDVPFSMIPKFNLFIALGIRDAIQQFSNERVTIKWSNDIYIGNKKIYGFSTEMVANYDEIEAVTCGIGISMNHVESNFDEDIKDKVTSICIYSDSIINRYTFLTALLTQIIHRFDQSLHQTFESIREEYIHAINIWHHQPKSTENNHQFLGEAIDIDSGGFLIVKDEKGQLHRLMSADIDL